MTDRYTCGTCLFHDTIGTTDVCRFYPPQPALFNDDGGVCIRQRWPEVWPDDDWCGEYRHRPRSRGEAK